MHPMVDFLVYWQSSANDGRTTFEVWEGTFYNFVDHFSVAYVEIFQLKRTVFGDIFVIIFVDSP